LNLEPERARALAEDNAPVIVVHPDEHLAPMSADEFIGGASLVWRESDENPPPPPIETSGNVQRARLGASSLDPYTHTVNGQPIFANQLTRPFEARSEDLSWLSLEEGFALVYEKAGWVETQGALRESLDTAPVYYEIRQGDSDEVFICYWMFFGSSAVPYDRTEALIDLVIDWVHGRIGPLVETVDWNDARRLVHEQLAHQGDWEGVTVKVPSSGEKSVQFRVHHGASTFSATELERDADGRFKVYCARGSHASFESTFSADKTGDLVAFDYEGLPWDPRTGSDRLIDATAQDWYGFGGAWGDPDLDTARSIGIKQKEFAGPLGPSSFKAIWSPT
jgi:hypothetical protein